MTSAPEALPPSETPAETPPVPFLTRGTPSIQMLRPRLDELPPLQPLIDALPPGYRFRTYVPGDEAGWAALMNTGEMNEWDVARVEEKLTGCPWPQFDPQGLFVITYGPDEVMAGSACAWLVDPAETERGTLHMVCVLPEHRGARLSYPLCLAVLHRFRERGFKRVGLSTHDWRLGAVKVYLHLGFQPWYRKPGQQEQWAAVLKALDWKEPVTPIVEEGAS